MPSLYEDFEKKRMRPDVSISSVEYLSANPLIKRVIPNRVLCYYVAGIQSIMTPNKHFKPSLRTLRVQRLIVDKRKKT
ncbi:hypothetical protein WA026_002346, partial [Henosepilachna vigintioctopunctata]